MNKLSKGELTKQRLLQSAAKEFAERGYHEAKISTIVSNVNLTQPSFYLYFKNKEAIFQELISHFRKQLIPFVEEPTKLPSCLMMRYRKEFK